MRDLIEAWMPVFVVLAGGGTGLLTLWYQSRVQRQNAREHAEGQKATREGFEKLDRVLAAQGSDINAMKADIGGMKVDVADVKTTLRDHAASIVEFKDCLAETQAAIVSQAADIETIKETTSA